MNVATFHVQMTTIYPSAQSLSPSATFPQNAQAGSSKGSQSSIRKKLPLPSASQAPLALAPKRKRNDTPEETSADSASSQPPRRGTTRRDGPKKKKASRACYHCQKAHLTCDDCNPIILFLFSRVDGLVQHDLVSVASNAALQIIARRAIVKRPNTF